MYFLIGISLVFACLYTINLIASLAASAIWNGCRRYATRFDGRGKADILFLLRVMPLTCAAILSFGLLVPSFLLHEPAESGERVGLKLGILVGVAIAGLAAAASRIFGSWWRTRNLIAHWLKTAEPMTLDTFDLPAFVIQHPFPVLAVVGVFRPRIFVATQVLEILSQDELTAALAHEIGHVSSRDNLKRLAMRLCGDMLVIPVGRSLDRQWLEAAESAADRFAARQGTAMQALDLASALVKIGKITPAGRVWDLPAGAYLTEPDDTSLASRVDDLVKLADGSEGERVVFTRRLNLFAVFLIALLALPALNDRSLTLIHRITETFFAGLQ